MRYSCLMSGFHIVNARDNALVEWIFSEYAHGDPAKFRLAMQAEAANLSEALRSRNVTYEELKSALIPTPDRRQIVFLFDWRDYPGHYGVHFARQVLPHLRKTLRCSVLVGDLLEASQPLPIDSFRGHLTYASEPIEWRAVYGMYFTNLLDSDVEALHLALDSEPRYRGFLDSTFESRTRDYMANTLVSRWVISGNRVIVSHGFDAPRASNVDLVGYGLTDFDYEVVSLDDHYFTTFMSYKIEARQVFQAAEDRALSLACVAGELVDIENVDINVPSAKLEKYLLVNESKLKLMTSIGLGDVTPDQLENIIRLKLSRGYIYDLRIATGDTPTFAVSTEFARQDGTPARRLIALKYDRDNKSINLVSMY